MQTKQRANPEMRPRVNDDTMLRSAAPAQPIHRRTFLRQLLRTAAVSGVTGPLPQLFAARSETLKAGEGRVDISPPTGITMGGFHYSPAKPRLITGIRQAPMARALVLQAGRRRTAIISFDMLNVSRDLARAVQKGVAKRTGLPAKHVRVCATHSHSMPSIAFNRHWGDQHPAYIAQIENQLVRAVRLAVEDLAPAELSVGRAGTIGANFNRTTKDWKTDQEFTPASTDAERWLDTTVHVLLFERAAPKKSLLWYNFSAHPVCHNDSLAGPDWPGLVEDLAREQGLPAPSFLQGHIGDVNPGHGEPWLGKADATAQSVIQAIREALNKARRVVVPELRVEQQDFPLPLDLDLFQKQIAVYRNDPSKCKDGEWVDAAFSRDWYETFASKYDPRKTHTPSSLAALRLGDVGLLFHGAELYSVYGLTIRRDSPLPETLVVGYADGYVGYLPDPHAYAAKEYAAVVVPKILNFPPFQPTAGRDLAAGALKLLRKVAV